MLDPRKDLKQDNMLWELVLTCATAYNDKQIFGNLHGLRCSGAQLILKSNTELGLKISSDEYDENKKNILKQKYVAPYIKEIKYLFNFVAEYYSKNKYKLTYYYNMTKSTHKSDTLFGP